MTENKQDGPIRKLTYLAFSLIFAITVVVALISDMGTTFFGRRTGPEYSASEYYREGLNYESKGDYEQAVISYRMEIERNPNSPAGYNSLAWLYADKLEINLGEGVSLAQEAVAIAKGSPLKTSDYALANYLDTLGWAYYKKGDYEIAVSTLEEAVLLDTGRKSIKTHLEEAKKAFERSVSDK